ncbi:Uncharacterised protein [Mycobacteroides abscessus subsp. massiliense]|nr:Uncharacterised protein [Mycobacteroides abscessus subsp. massiliense]
MSKVNPLCEVKDPEGYPGLTFYQAQCSTCEDRPSIDCFEDFSAAFDEAVSCGWFEVLKPLPGGGEELDELLCPRCQHCEVCGKPGRIGEVDNHLVCDDHYDYFG